MVQIPSPTLKSERITRFVSIYASFPKVNVRSLFSLPSKRVSVMPHIRLECLLHFTGLSTFRPAILSDFLLRPAIRFTLRSIYVERTKTNSVEKVQGNSSRRLILNSPSFPP
jgi:hypothetical protein